MRIKLKSDIIKGKTTLRWQDKALTGGKTTLRAGKTTSLARHNKFKADNSEE